VAEVKSPRYHGSPAKDPWDVTVKLGNEMKDSIVDNNVGKDVVVCGLLVDGFQCNLYAMDLKFDAIYRMIRLDRFYLPRDQHDLSVVLSAIEVLSQAKKIVARSAEICIASFRSTLNPDWIPRPIPRPKSKMTRPSSTKIDL
jgi:hypothetical protein